MDQLKVIAFTYKQTPLKELNRFFLHEENRKERLEFLKYSCDISEILYIPTCNRIEFVFTGAEAEWEMLLFKNEELINYLTAQQVGKSVYEYVVYDSEIERAFAKRLDEREDIRLFVKLPRWFEIDTPVGKYNPDWAIVKHEDQTLYLVRETKGTRDFLKLRTSEADKVRCGQRHFEALGVPFDIAVIADEV